MILEKTQEQSKDAQAQALREELESLKPRALKKRARDAGVDEGEIDEADDADDVKGTLITLIVDHVAERSRGVAEAAAAALAQELEGLKPRALKKRAAEEGVDGEKIDEADDAEDVKAALIALILEKAGFLEERVSGPTRDSASSTVAASPAHQGTPSRTDAEGGIFGTKHVVLSYQWDCQKKVTTARDLLKKRGVPTWMDIGASAILACTAAAVWSLSVSQHVRVYH
eukprot:COSAG02_NODE_5854_length_3987_cov_169.941872_4_plen_228_part_00